MSARKLPLGAAEPAMVRAVVVVLALLASLGLSWAADVDAETITAWAIAAGVVVPILQGLWTRYAVTANAKVVSRVSTELGRVVAGDAAVLPTGQPLEGVLLDDGTGEVEPVQVQAGVLQ